MAQVCVIFGAGEYYAGTPVVPAGAYVVAADGGLDHTRELGIVPDVVVGDFDSLEGRPPRTDVRTIALPALKDDPDMLSALKVGWSAGCREFHVYGGLGGRIDHTISGIQLMALLARHGASGYLYGDGLIVTAITDGRLSFPAHPVPEDGRMVSAFSHSDVSLGVNEPGLKYELKDGHADQYGGAGGQQRVPRRRGRGHQRETRHTDRHLPHRSGVATGEQIP